MNNKSCLNKIPAMILAAGYGTRLAPLTQRIPKPLIPLANNDTLLGTVIQGIRRYGVNHFVVNGHYLSEQIESYLNNFFPKESLFLGESEILGTGGALVNAKNKLDYSDCFILHNGDILTNLDFEDLVKKHQDSGNLATLVLLDGPENKVLMTEKYQIVDILGSLECQTQGQLLTYAGIAVLSKDIFKYLPEVPQNVSLIKGFIEALKNDEKIGGYVLNSTHYWSDLGTIEQYLKANKEIHEGRVGGWIQRENLCYGMTPITEQGSARSFYRLKGPWGSWILMLSDASDLDFNRFIVFGQHLATCHAGVPQIYGWNNSNYTVLMEDLGELTLYQKVQKLDDSMLLSVYQDVIVALIQYQKKATDSHIEAIEGMRFFDYDYLRWETNYFFHSLIEDHFAIYLSVELKNEIMNEFHQLAVWVDHQPKVFMHRDCQSQNIIIQSHKIGFVDFQGGRIGPFAYDLMSLVLDPYLNLSECFAQQMIDFYWQQINLPQMALNGCQHLSRNDFDTACLYAGLQRLMQALGAYGFLSHHKGKSQYLAFIYPGLKKLALLLKKTEQFPVLKKLVDSLIIDKN